AVRTDRARGPLARIFSASSSGFVSYTRGSCPLGSPHRAGVTMDPRSLLRAGAALAFVLSIGSGVGASSHREAPFITTQPKVDGTDLYLFRSYEPGRSGFVTLIANYQGLQDSYGGPNYFTMDPDALY